jgi:ABC-type phosphate/phosphonate transport system substrate-binding protein
MTAFYHFLSVYLISCLFSVCFVTPLFASSEQQEIRLGVLAKRGEEIALQQWGATARYLEDKIDGFTCRIVPLDFDAVDPAVQNQEVDFILTNSAMYIGLLYHHGIRRVLTLKNRRLDHDTIRFGGVIFTRADNRKIKQLQDVRGTHFMAG